MSKLSVGSTERVRESDERVAWPNEINFPAPFARPNYFVSRTRDCSSQYSSISARRGARTEVFARLDDLSTARVTSETLLTSLLNNSSKYLCKASSRSPFIRPICRFRRNTINVPRGPPRLCTAEPALVSREGSGNIHSSVRFNGHSLSLSLSTLSGHFHEEASTMPTHAPPMESRDRFSSKRSFRASDITESERSLARRGGRSPEESWAKEGAMCAGWYGLAPLRIHCGPGQRVPSPSISHTTGLHPKGVT